jgi:hypothetical protein
MRVTSLAPCQELVQAKNVKLEPACYDIRGTFVRGSFDVRLDYVPCRVF